MIVEDRFYVGYSDINHDKKLSNSAMLKFFEDIAGMHGNIAGENILTADTTWVLTSYHVIVLKRPLYGTKVTVRTWAHEMKGVSSYREYEILDENGERAAVALSNWAHINVKNKKLEKVSELLSASYQPEDEKTNFPEVRTKKLSEPEAYSAEKPFAVDRNFIDTNGHMNNVFYLDLADTVLPDEVYGDGEYDEFEITYRREIKYGEHIRCLYAETSDSHIVAFKGAEDSDIRAIIKLNK